LLVTVERENNREKKLRKNKDGFPEKGLETILKGRRGEISQGKREKKEG